MKTMSDMVIERIQTAQQGTELECLKNLDHIYFQRKTVIYFVIFGNIYPNCI